MSRIRALSILWTLVAAGLPVWAAAQAPDEAKARTSSTGSSGGARTSR
jgi:hypothetical protein